MKTIIASLGLLLLFFSQLGFSNELNCTGPLQGEQRHLRSEQMSNLCELSQGKVTLVVNTASQCGYTGQFEGLEALYQTYKEQGFVIVGFPSDSFKQELADEAAVAEVCFANYGVTFPMLTVSPVTGRQANPVFAALAREVGPPAWNFHKYLVGRDGQIIAAFPSAITPMSTDLTHQIEAALAVK